MTTEAPLKILMVEDAGGVARGVIQMVDDIEDATERKVEFRHMSSVKMLRDAIAKGESCDIALIDLDLGVGQETGLAAMEVLSATPTPPHLIVWTEAYDVDRTLCCVAARAWFDVKATYNKVGGRSLEQDNAHFLQLIKGVLAGEAPHSPNHMNSARVRETFHGFFTDDYFFRWKAFVTEEHALSAAVVAHVSEGTLRRWLGQEDPPVGAHLVERFWEQVAAAVKTDPACRPRDSYLQTIDRSRAERLAHGPTAIVHNFASSQRLFFLDPYVEARVLKLGKNISRKDPIGY